MDSCSHYLRVCEEAVRAGGQVLQQWAGRIEVRKKGPADLVTQADFASQEVVRRIVLGAFPSHSLLGEEGEPSDHPANPGDFSNLRASENGTVPFARTRRIPLDRRSPRRHDELRPRRAALLRLAGAGAQRRTVGRGRIRPGPRRVFHGRPGPGGAARRPAHSHQPRGRTLGGVGRRRLPSQRLGSTRPTCCCFSKCSRVARPSAAPAPRP